MFNYRGYGRSSGAPSPAANGRDGAALCVALKRVCGVPRLLVHGES